MTGTQLTLRRIEQEVGKDKNIITGIVAEKHHLLVSILAKKCCYTSHMLMVK